MCNGRPGAVPGMTTTRALAWSGVAAAAVVVLLIAEVVVAVGRDYLVDVDFTVDRTVGRGKDPGRPDIEVRLLGDSTVAGVGTDGDGDALPTLVAERVAAQTGRRVHVAGLGVSGARTADVHRAQLPVVDDDVDVLVIVVGSNDVVHVTPPWRLRAETRALLVAARRRGVPVVLGGIPRFAGVTAMAQPLRAVADTYAGIQREAQRAAASQVAGVTFVDIAALASPRFAGRPEAFSSDEFHPSTIGYGFWADALAPAVAAAALTRGTPTPPR